MSITTQKDNNTNNNNFKPNGTQACAACKYQRRKCASDCLLAPYFPHHLHRQFLNAHKLFGVSNITKIIRPLPQAQKDQAMRTIKFESDVRATDPVGGSCHIILNLQRQIDFACAELDLVLQQLAICRAASAADTVSLMCDPDPQLTHQIGGAESQNENIHYDSIVNNNVQGDASNEYKSADEAISPLRQQTQLHAHTNSNNDVLTQRDNEITSNPDDQFYLQDIRHLDGNNEEEDVGIGEYFLEGDEVNNENSNVSLSLQDIEASWAMQDALAYCFHDKEGFINECKDFKTSDEEISKEDKVFVQEETTSCISKDQKPNLREVLETTEDAQSHDLRITATIA